MSILLTRDELNDLEEGFGWEEIIYDPVPDEGKPEERGVERIAWTGRHVCYAERGCGLKSKLLENYNRKRGVRIWVGENPPTKKWTLRHGRRATRELKRNQSGLPRREAGHHLPLDGRRRPVDQ